MALTFQTQKGKRKKKEKRKKPHTECLKTTLVSRFHPNKRITYIKHFKWYTCLLSCENSFRAEVNINFIYFLR